MAREEWLQNCRLPTVLSHCLAGKQVGHPVSAAFGSASSLKAAFTVHNKTVHFLIDTGATLSIISEHTAYSLNCFLRSTHVRLSAADGRELHVLAECSLKLSSKILRRDFPWTFVVVNVSLPIIGVDFLTNFHLVIDCSSRSLLDNKTTLSMACSPISHSSDS